MYKKREQGRQGRYKSYSIKIKRGMNVAQIYRHEAATGPEGDTLNMCDEAVRVNNGSYARVCLRVVRLQRNPCQTTTIEQAEQKPIRSPDTATIIAIFSHHSPESLVRFNSQTVRMEAITHAQTTPHHTTHNATMARAPDHDR
jgi:hypothetical protein